MTTSPSSAISPPKHPLACSQTMVEFSRSGDTVIECFELLSKYQMNEGLGFGTFGFVAGAIDTETNEEVAIKKFKNVFQHPRLALCAVREIFLLSHFNHDNIIQLKDLIIPVRNIQSIEQLRYQMTSFDEVYIVLKKYDMNLRELCENMEVELQRRQRSYLMYQMLRGMKGIHSARVMHRDLKPDNILMTCEFDVAIGDFGSGRGATGTSAGTSMMATHLNQVCTQWYRAPEAALSLLNSDGSLDITIKEWTAPLEVMCSSDVWSIGCIMAELLVRQPLFKATSGDIKQLEKIFDVMGTPTEEYIQTRIKSERIQKYLSGVKQRKGTFDDTFSAEAFPECEDEIDLLRKMLTFSAEDRITIAMALEHPYVAEWHDSADEPESSVFSLPCDGNVTVEQSRHMIWQEMCKKHPEISELEAFLEMKSLEKKQSGSVLKSSVMPKGE